MSNTKVTKILMRNGTRQEWVNADTMASLEIGEIGFESDTYRMKIGNVDNDTVGKSFHELDYFAAGIVSIQEVDSTHENGLMIDSVGKLELDIGHLVGRVDDHDSVLADHEDSIKALRAGFDTVAELLDEIELSHTDSIETLIDSITINADSISVNKDSVEFIKDSIETFPDSVQAIYDILDEKVDKAGDTMTGTLSFEPEGIIQGGSGSNIFLRDDLTIVQTNFMCSENVAVLGDQFETSNNYTAVSENDVLDVKALKDHRRRVVMSQKSSTDGGGILYKENHDVLTYRQSIKLQPIAEQILDDIEATEQAGDTVDAVGMLKQFFEYIRDYPDMKPLEIPYDIIDEDML